MAFSFQKDDIVRFKQDQDFTDAPLSTIERIRKYIATGELFKVVQLKAARIPGKELLSVTRLSDSGRTEYYAERFEVVAIVQPTTSARWGDAAPVTSHAGRKISDEERKLIEYRIATRRALHGGE